MILEENDDGSFTAVYDWRTFRFLLSDGRTVDVRAIVPDSLLSTAILAQTKAKKIEGFAILDPPADIKPVPSKRPAKTMGRMRG